MGWTCLAYEEFQGKGEMTTYWLTSRVRDSLATSEHSYSSAMELDVAQGSPEVFTMDQCSQADLD